MIKEACEPTSIPSLTRWYYCGDKTRDRRHTKEELILKHSLRVPTIKVETLLKQECEVDAHIVPPAGDEREQVEYWLTANFLFFIQLTINGLALKVVLSTLTTNGMTLKVGLSALTTNRMQSGWGSLHPNNQWDDISGGSLHPNNQWDSIQGGSLHLNQWNSSQGRALHSNHQWDDIQGGSLHLINQWDGIQGGSYLNLDNNSDMSRGCFLLSLDLVNLTTNINLCTYGPFSLFHQ